MASAESTRSGLDVAREYVGEIQERLQPGPINVGDTERMASKIGGGVLLALGLMRGGLKGLVMGGLGGALLYRGVTGHCHLYEAIGADTSDAGYEPGPMNAVPAQHGVRVEEAITINRPASELFAHWRNFRNLPQFMSNIESVTPIDANRSHWVAKGPMGATLEWDAVIHNETPNELIAWRSVEGSEVNTAGSVRFRPAPGDRGTEVRVNLKFDPPGGKLAVAASKIFGEDPAGATRETLRRFKQLMEAGEIASVQGQSSGPA